MTSYQDTEGDAIPTYLGEDLPPRTLTPDQLRAWCDQVATAYQAGWQSGRDGAPLRYASIPVDLGHTFPKAITLGHQDGRKALMAALRVRAQTW